MTGKSLAFTEGIWILNVVLTETVGYLESNYLVNHAKKIVTDSGGLQREAFSLIKSASQY